ncbi:MAG: tetratricopeptide repeat protein [Candidatus Bilamarchaeaceae archaeon]
MASSESAQEVRRLIASGQLGKARNLIDAGLARKETHEFWYLRALISFRLGSYDHAEECLERAMWLRKEPEYRQLKGLVCMERGDFVGAVPEFTDALRRRKDAASQFYLSVCYMMLGDPKSKDMLQKAYITDPKATARLLSGFYSNVIANDRAVDRKTKEAIAAKLRKLGAA